MSQVIRVRIAQFYAARAQRTSTQQTTRRRYTRSVADRFDDVEQILDRHARRLARELGGMIVEVGETLRRAGEPGAPDSPATSARDADPSRGDLYREATRLGVPGRSKMSKEQLRTAVERAKQGKR
jgi:hypothetical protein